MIVLKAVFPSSHELSFSNFCGWEAFRFGGDVIGVINSKVENCSLVAF